MPISRRNLPLNALRAFEVAARHCHLRRAAEELGVTHGAVSRQIRQLESLLSVQLFDRSGNRLALSQLSLIHISEPTRRATISRMPSSA